MIDWNKPVQTRDGREARVLATDLKGNAATVAAAVVENNGQEILLKYYADGSYFGDGEISDTDLVNVPETRTIYLNVYKNGQGQLIAFEGNSPFSEDGRRPGGCVGRIKVVLEEGRFDD